MSLDKLVDKQLKVVLFNKRGNSQSCLLKTDQLYGTMCSSINLLQPVCFQSWKCTLNQFVVAARSNFFLVLSGSAIHIPFSFQAYGPYLLSEMFCSIYTGAAMEVNISHRCRQEILTTADLAHPDLFNNALNELLQLMKMVSLFPGFMQFYCFHLDQCHL